MKEDQNEMIRYFSDFLSEINLIITNIKGSVYQLIDIHLTPSKSKTVFQSMSSIILGTHKTYDDLKKIQSILSGIIKSKRISSDYSVSSKKRSKTTYSRLNPPTQKIEKNGDNDCYQVVLPNEANEANEAKTIKRKVMSKTQIKQVMQRSASSEEEIIIRNNTQHNNKTQDNMTVKHSVERGIQPSCSQIIQAKNIHANSQLRIKNIVKQNGVSLSKIIETNNQCLRIVRSAKKELRSKKRK